MFKRTQISSVPSEGILLGPLKAWVQSAGTDSMHVTIIRQETGYSLHAHVGYQPKKTYFLETEKSHEKRIFKTVESAFNVCRQLGYRYMTVEI